MLVSHKHKFIFLKTRKTAGTSIEISLSRYCGDDGIVTPIAAEDEAVRFETGATPRNWERSAKLLEIRPADALSALRTRKWPRRPLYWNHMPANMVRSLVGDEVWETYFKFCFVRDPWDQAASFHRWAQKTGARLTLEQVIKRKLPIRNWNVYTIDDDVVVDFIGRYEDLDRDLAEACRRIGVDYDGWLPRTKQTAHPEMMEDHFTPELVEAVRRRHAAEILMFGYEYAPAVRPALS